MWHVLQPNPELRRYRLLFSVTRPPAAVFSHEDYGEAARCRSVLEKYGSLTARDVALQLQAALRGEVDVTYAGVYPESYVYPSGDEDFVVGGMLVSVFFYAGDYDHVDSAAMPDGRTWHMPEWDTNWNADSPPEESFSAEVDNYWYPEFGAKNWPGMLDEMLKAAMERAAREKSSLERQRND